VTNGSAFIEACPDCGTLQRLPERLQADTLSCVGCGTLMERRQGKSQAAALASAAATLLLLAPANLAPFLTTSVLGVSRQSILASSAQAMLQDGWPALAIVVFLFVVILPPIRFALLTLVLGLLQFDRRPSWLGRAFRVANALQTWAMADVFLLGLAVAYARLRASISVEVGVGAMCFIAVGVLSLFTRALLDQGEVWRRIGPQRVAADVAQPTLSCTRCDLLLPLRFEGCRCPRCAATVHARKPESQGRSLALTAAAVLFYIPANLYPLATLPIGLTPTKYTVLEGIIDLADAKLIGLAVLVFCASFAIPFLKLAGLSWCISSVMRRSKRRLVTKTRLFNVIEEIGRWSMVDPFVIGCFTPVMHYNAFIYGRAEAAAVPFTAVVILTIIASKTFDPRRMWDAARSRP
jgi:paraquat-inducible protein A